MDAPRDVSFDFMFPHAKNSPAISFEQASDFCIALHIPADFCSPEFGIGLWDDTVLRAGVPEASVDKYYDTRSDEG